MIANLETYPYQPGVEGIPLDQIVKDNEETTKTLTGESGYPIEVFKNRDHLWVTGTDRKFKYGLMAILNKDGGLSFGLNTKLQGRDVKKLAPRTRYPDLFARHFVGFAINYFEMSDQEVNYCMGIWSFGSDNYSAFFRNLKQSGNIIEAAEKTWSGRAFSSYGFSEVREIRISDNGNVKGKMVTSKFYRPNS